MYDKYINELQIELTAVSAASGGNSNSSESLDSPPVRPMIKSPRAATQHAVRPAALRQSPPHRSLSDSGAAPLLDFRATLEAEDNEDEQDDDATLTPSPCEEVAPWPTTPKETTPPNGGTNVPWWRRDSAASEAGAESAVWSAASSSSGPLSPDSPPAALQERSADECAAWMLEQLLQDAFCAIEAATQQKDAVPSSGKVKVRKGESVRCLNDVEFERECNTIPSRPLTVGRGRWIISVV